MANPDIHTKKRRIIECLQYLISQASDKEMFPIHQILIYALDDIKALEVDCKDVELEPSTMQAFYFFMNYIRAPKALQQKFAKELLDFFETEETEKPKKEMLN